MTCVAMTSARVRCVRTASAQWRYVFFFSSRRRHTRCSRDWSSDVCSSDLYSMSATVDFDATSGPSLETQVANRQNYFGQFTWKTYPEQLEDAGISWKIYSRSEERRVGKERRTRVGPDH